jgi:mannose-1-phosphate guanylyltransferase
MIPVIICGGVGTKMWPASRQSLPKHFLPLIEGKSLFQITYDSLRKKFEAKDIYVSTTAGQVDLARLQESEIPEDNFILEPEMKNHGPATGLVAAFLVKKGLGDEPFMLVQPDDLREPEEKFFEMMDACDELARREKKYITGGIKPDYAIMGIDYLVKGDKVETANGVEVYKVAKFVWRGTKEMAEELIKDGQALTHSNHTCMTPNNLLEMLQKYKTEWYEPLMNYVNGAELATEYSKMPKGPIEDVTQKVHEAGESLVVELPFKWFDIGTWESLERYEVKSQKSKVKSQKVIEIESENNYIRSDKHVALIGIEGLTIIDTPDAILICKKDMTGRVGEVVEKLKADGKTELV